MFLKCWTIIFSLIFCVVLVKGGFFDLTDLEDPLTLLWNLPSKQENNYAKCDLDNNNLGICMEKHKCKFSGGIASKKCGLFFTCCSFQNDCRKSSSSKISHFKSGNLSSGLTNCQYTIKLRNKNVCQIRLDFEEFILAPAILTPFDTKSDDLIFSCSNDSFNVHPDNFGVPTLCGNNSKQHVYIHINQSSTDQIHAVTLNINLADRLNPINQYLPSPKWNIKFTQLECPVSNHRKFEWLKYSSTADLNTINNDVTNLAPHGVIQYYPELVGEIRSFGYNSTKLEQFNQLPTGYPYGSFYTIGFRRSSNICGIKFTPIKMNLLREATDPIFSCLDYLSVPEFFQENLSPTANMNFLGGTTEISKICSTSKPFYSLVPGPISLIFKAKGKINEIQNVDLTENLGYHLKYELLTQCPEN